MEWPVKHESTGEFETEQTGKKVWKDAMEAVMALQGEMSLSPELDDRVEDLLEWLDGCEQWKKYYRHILAEFGHVCALLTSEQVIVLANAGLQAVHETMKFRIDDETVVSAKEAFMQAIPQGSGWKTRALCGGKDAKNCTNMLALPSPVDPSRRLEGHAAVEQVQAWVKYGCAEPSVELHGAKLFLAHSELIKDMIIDKVFVLLDVASALGPAKPLLQLSGSRIIGVSQDGTKLQDLVDWFELEGNSEATLQVPGNDADFLTDGPRIARWIVETLPDDRQEVVICHLAYMDGEANVRTSVAMDLIAKYVTAHCDESDKRVSLSFLTTPTVVHMVPPEAARDASHRFQHRPFWQRAMHATSRSLKPWSFDERPCAVLNGLITHQGPDYALAKTIQQWRCMVAACRDNRVVSAPLAPATRSASLVGHDSASCNLEGLQRLGPMVVFDSEQTSCLMAAVLLSQLSTHLPPRLEHPMQCFWDGSVHGGVWRCPFESEGTAKISFTLGKTTLRRRVPPDSVAGSALSQVDKIVMIASD